MQQGIENQVNQSPKAPKEDAITTSALEEARRQSNTQAQDKKPTSDENTTTTHPMLVIPRHASRGVLQQQQQAVSTLQAGALRTFTSHSGPRARRRLVDLSWERTPSRG